LDKLQLDKVYQQFLVIADQKKEIEDKDLPKIIEASNI
jgi:2-isopropylmalate synthase